MVVDHNCCTAAYGNTPERPFQHDPPVGVSGGGGGSGNRGGGESSCGNARLAKGGRLLSSISAPHISGGWGGAKQQTSSRTHKKTHITTWTNNARHSRLRENHAITQRREDTTRPLHQSRKSFSQLQRHLPAVRLPGQRTELHARSTRLFANSRTSDSNRAHARQKKSCDWRTSRGFAPQNAILGDPCCILTNYWMSLYSLQYHSLLI